MVEISDREKKINALDEYCGSLGCPDCAIKNVKGYDPDLPFEEFSDECLDACLKAIEDAKSAKELAAIPRPKVAPPTETSLKDAVHPHHYKLPCGMQVVDVEVAMFGREAVMAHCLCTASEYILRSRQKNGVEDIKKAHWWLCEYLELEAEGHGK